MATPEFSGPIDFLVFGFPASADLGEGLRDVLGRVDAGQIELLDLEVIGIDAAARPTEVPLAELNLGDDTLAQRFDGAFSGILDAADRDAIAAELNPGDVAIAIVYEDRSLAVAARAWISAGGRELFAGGIDITDLESALQEGPTT